MPDRSTLSRPTSFVDLLRERVSAHPDRAAFVFLQDGCNESERLSFADLDRRARTIGAHLQSRGLAGQRALLLYNPGLDFIAAFFGCLYAGVTAVPAYPPRSNPLLARLASIIGDAEVAVALTASAALEGIASRFAELGAIAPSELIATDSLQEDEASPWREPPIRSDDLAFLQYTSGSTGQPKGVMVSHANLLHNSRLIQLCFGDTTESIGVSWLPPYHDMGLVGGILQSLYAGSTTYLMAPATFLQRPLRWLEAIARTRATTAGGPNFAYEYCARQIQPEQIRDLDLRSWTLAFTGAEPVRAETIDLFCERFAPCGFRREAFLPCYGLAENTLIVSGGGRGRRPVMRHFDAAALLERRVLEVPPSATAGRALVASGPAVGDLDLKVVDPDTALALPEGRIGEIWVSGDSVAQGYRNLPERSRDTFRARLNGTDANGGRTYMRTGDLGFLLDGELFVNGRLKDLIIIRGSNHYPQDIEASVETSHPALRTGCGAAFAVEAQGEERLVLVQEVERSALRRLDATTVCAAIRSAVAERHQLQPWAILLLKTGAIPKTSSGKIQRYACRQRFLEGGFEPVGEWRQAVAAVEPAAASAEVAPAALGTDPGATCAEASPGQGMAPDAAVTPVPMTDPAAGSDRLSEPERRIRAWFRTYLAARLGERPEAIELDRPLAQMGLDSMAAVRLSADLEDWLAASFPERPPLSLSPTLAYDHPTIARIAAALASESEAVGAAAAGSAPHSAAGGRPLRDDDIAVVGVGCRFPGASSPQAFWELLRRGGDAIRSAEAAAALDRGFGAAAADQAGFLEAIDRFDAAFFGIPGREADQMDPQQRLLLETAWEAFEQAGIPPERWAGTSAGVFVGISSSDYAQLQPLHQPSVYWGTGNAHSIAANRLSFLLDLRGPSLAIDTACSSSLVAVHQAVRSLQLGECSQAIAAGVNLLLLPALTETFRQAGMLAPDGRCKTFDADADGYVRGEGCGVVLLKRLAEARRDGDTVWGVIAGSAINQDGRSNGLTAPSGPAQQTVVRQALDRAGISPATITYVETHGTGTSLGDPIEVNALRAVLASGRSHEQPCWLGSVKANLGHLEAAAGIAGLIKVLLCLRHGELPPQLHVRRSNPLIQLEGSPFRINSEPEPWPPGPRWAGLSSFGFGGSNAHLVLTAPPPPPAAQQPGPERPCHLLRLSARSAEALQELRQRHAALLSAESDAAATLADHCASANLGRSQLPFRDAWVAQSAAELAAALRADTPTPASAPPQPSLAFLFTGQGSQMPGMAAELLGSQPRFRDTIMRCDAELAQLAVLPQGLTLPDLLRQPADDATAQRIARALENTAITQPVLFSLELALADLWRSWGVQPDWLMGHSVGEYVAACVAGVFEPEAGLRLIAARARLMAALPAGGGMVAVFADAATVAALLRELGSPLVIAADNGPANVVVSGPLQALETLETALLRRGLAGRRLKVSHAFHSPLMEPMLAEFRAIAAALPFREPQLPILSNLTGEPIGAAIASADHWCRHLLAPVAFGSGLRQLRQRGVAVLLEIGPKPTLIEMGRAGGLHPEAHWLASLRPGQPDTRQMLESLAELHRLGIPIDWAGFEAPFRHRRVPLPTYPWQHRRHWLPIPRAIAAGPQAGAADRPSPSPGGATTEAPSSFRSVWLPQPLPPAAGDDSIRAGQWLLCGPASLREALTAALPAGQSCCWIETTAAPDCERISATHWRFNPCRSEHWLQCLEGLAAAPLGLLQVPEPAATAAAAGDARSPARGSAELEAALRDSEILPVAARALLEHYGPAAPPRIWWLSDSASAEGGGTAATSMVVGMARGFARCLALEQPELWGGWLQIADLSSAAGVTQLVRELQAASGSGSRGLPDVAVRWTSGSREVARLEETALPAAPPSTREPERPWSDGQVLISGGLGALGLATAAWLVERGVPSLLLVGRQGAAGQTEALLESWRQGGCEVRVLAADLGDPACLEALTATLATSSRPLRAIVHAAGVLEDGLLSRLSPEQWQRVARPKVAAAWHLHQLSLAHPVDRFVLYSSLASLLGSPGQCAYGAANGGLDALADHRRQLGLPALSVQWGPWSGSGMADRGRARSGRSLQSLGVTELPAAPYLAALEALLTSRAASSAGPTAPGTLPASLALARLRTDLIGPLLAGRPQAAFLAAPLGAEGTASQPAPGGAPPTGLRADLLALAPQQRTEPMLAYLRATLARLLQRDQEAIEPDLHLLEAATDSLMVMDAISQIQADLGLMLYPREVYEHPRVGALADYLTEAFNRSQGQEPPADAIAAAIETLPAALQLPTGRAPRPAAAGPKLPPAVFVLSSPRAGSTLLRVMLAGHPQLFSPPELHLLPFASMGERAEALASSHLGEGLERALMELEGSDAESCRRRLDAWQQEDRPVAWVYRQLQELAGDRLLVDKSPTYALHPETLAQAEAWFEEPRYIHLIRHPYAVIRSFVDLRMDRLLGVSDADPYRLAETIWRHCNHNVQALHRQIGDGRVLQLRYEDLVSDPAGSLRRLCAFLHIPFHEALLAPYEGSRLTDGPHRQSLSVGDPNFRRHRGIEASLAEAWRKADLPWPLEAASQELARAYGYSLPREEGGPAPEPPAASPPAAMPATPERREAFVAVAGLNLCRCEWGPPDGQPVLCLHGLLDQGLIWEPVAGALAAAGFRVIAPDLRGHGRSDHVGPGGGYQPLDFIGDAVALVDELLDRPFLVVGHSLGSVVASGLASLRDDRIERLVLIEPVLPSSSSGQNVRDTVNTLVTYALEPPRHSVMADQAAAVERLRRALPSLQDGFAQRLVERATVAAEGGLLWRWDAVLQTRMSLNLQSGPLHRAAYLQLLEGLRPPITVLQGSTSGFNRAEDLEDLSRALARAERRQIEGGHTLMVDSPEVLAAALLRALGAAAA